MDPDDIIQMARERISEILGRAREEGRRQAAPYTFRPGEGPRGLAPDQAKAGVKATGLLGAGMLPVVGEAMDVHEMVEGFKDKDPGRAALGFGSLLLPFATAKGIRAYGDIRQSRRALQEGFSSVADVAEEYPSAVRTGARAAGDVARAAEPRMVAAPALKIEDPSSPKGYRIFTGKVNHADAAMEARDAGFRQEAADALLGKTGRGFVDRRGNFMQDREAINVGIRSGQLQNYKGPRNNIPAESFFRRSKDADWNWGTDAVMGDPNNPIPKDVPLPTRATSDPLQMPRERFDRYIEDLPPREQSRLIEQRTRAYVDRAAADDPSAMMRIKQGTEAEATPPGVRPLADDEAVELAGRQAPEGASLASKPGPIDDALLEAHFEGDAPGSTINPRTGQNMAGEDTWVVSTFKDREASFDELTPEIVSEYRAKNADLLEDEKYFLGSWEDDDGKQVLDVVRTYDRQQDAIRAGGRADQDGIFHLGREEYRPLTAWERAKNRRAYARTEKGRAEIEEEMLQGLTPRERRAFEQADASVRRNAVLAYASAPSPRRMTSMALKGAPVKGWYDASALQLAEGMGEEAPRFAALTAASSPQVSVDRNLDLSMKIWEDWVDAGRPQDPDIIREIVGASGHPYPESVKNNAVRALTASQDELMDPAILEAGGFLSGPKVDPFYANLMGNTQRVVSDTHMARAYGTKPKGVGTVARTYAQNALIGNTAMSIENLTGHPVQRAQVQEMVWAPVRAATEMSTARPRGTGEYGSALDAIREQAAKVEPDVPFTDATAGALDRRVAETPSFATLINDPERRAFFEQFGEGPPRPRAHGGLGDFDPGLIRQADLEDIAQRIDAVRSGKPFYSVMPWAIGAGAGARMLQQQREEPRGLLTPR